jgi:hypothetical protein
MSKAINAIKDGYIYVIDGIDAHPHITLWSGLGLIVLALVV